MIKASHPIALLAKKHSIAILVIFYLVGIVGATVPLHPDFLLLTPLNLLLSLALVLWRHPHWSGATWRLLVISFLTGYFAELFGVKTGMLFGNYYYEQVLGPKLWDTPPMIGVNWILLTYSAGVLVNHLAPNRHWVAKAAIAAAAMVMLDVVIEPVAIHYHFWQWVDGYPPLQNYIGWFAVAFPLQLLFMKTQGDIRNKVAVALFMLQWAFFLSLWFLRGYEGG